MKCRFVCWPCGNNFHGQCLFPKLCHQKNRGLEI